MICMVDVCEMVDVPYGQNGAISMVKNGVFCMVNVWKVIRKAGEGV